MTEPPETEPPQAESAADPDQRSKGDGLELAREIANAYRTSAPKQRRRAGRKSAAPRGTKRAARDDPEPLAQFLGKLIADQGWEDNLAAQQVFTDWAAIVGAEVAQHCIISGYEDGQLEVEADSTAWATQLRLLAPRIVAKLNARLGEGSVVRINISGPKGPSWIKGKRTIRNARGPRDTYG